MAGVTQTWKLSKGEVLQRRSVTGSSIETNKPVGVWGVGIAASYGYVGGTGLRPVHQAKPPAIN